MHYGTTVRNFSLCLEGRAGVREEGKFKDGSPEAVIHSMSLCHLNLFLLICVYLCFKYVKGMKKRLCVSNHTRKWIEPTKSLSVPI